MDADRQIWIDYENAHRIFVPAELQDPHILTRKTAAAYGWAINNPFDRNKLNPLDWFDVRTRDAKQHRVLRLLEALLKACETRGFEFVQEAGANGICILVEGEPIAIKLIERGAMVTHLSLEAGERHTGRKIWKDAPRRPLEKRLNDVMVGLRSIAAKRKADRCRYDEEERKAAEFMRQRAELRERVTEEKAAIDGLLAEANDWQQAQTLRAYIATVEALPVKQKQRSERAAWVQWARDQADRLDPLIASPPSIMDTPRSDYRELGPFEALDENGNIEQI